MENSQLQSLKNRYDIIGTSPALNRALELAVAVAPTDLTALVVGESGVGKETIPRIIHQHSRRKSGRYFAVNCGAIPEGTIDSELFGHERGAFTGASEMRKGYFEEADGGTLFLDEIGELPLSSQAKLLRVLQDGEFIRVGSSKVLRTDVRVVAATNVDLSHAVSRGKFRADLYYRLCSVTIKVPALRERQDDIPLLFRKFASDISEKYGMTKVNLTPDAVAMLKDYRWPGNIRQLKNVAESVAVLESSSITPLSGRCEVGGSVLSKYMPQDNSGIPAVASHEEGFSPSEREAVLRMIYSLRQEVAYLREKVDSMTGSAPTPVEADEAEWQDTEAPLGGMALAPVQPVSLPGQSADLSIERAGNELIRKALEKHDGNRKAAAAELGISERTLYRKIKEIDNEN